jgi:hypothetical protein
MSPTTVDQSQLLLAQGDEDKRPTVDYGSTSCRPFGPHDVSQWGKEARSSCAISPVTEAFSYELETGSS